MIKALSGYREPTASSSQHSLPSQSANALEGSSSKLDLLPTEQMGRTPRAAALAVLEAMRLDGKISGPGQAGEANDIEAKDNGFDALVATQSQIARRYAEF